MTRGHTDKPHVLVIEAVGDGLEPATQWRIVHPPTCPWEAMRWRDLLDGDSFMEPSGPLRWHFHRCCLAQAETENIGLEGLDGWEKLAPGRYRIQYESVYYPGEFGGSWGAEWDVEVSLLDDAVA